MTIHFRSRIKTPINYSQELFMGKIGCCCTGSAPTDPFESTYQECNKLGGYFTVSSSETGCVPCPEKGTTGCCCSCAYNGLTSGIERCACEDLGGNWQPGSCIGVNPDHLCVSDEIDARVLKKCCGYTLSSGNVLSICVDVCTEEECSKLGIQNYIPIFFPNSSCTQNSTCPIIQGNFQYLANSSIITGNSENDTYGNCCIQGNPCRCFTSISMSNCRQLNGSFYQLGDIEFSCEDCIANCTKGTF